MAPINSLPTNTDTRLAPLSGFSTDLTIGSTVRAPTVKKYEDIAAGGRKGKSKDDEFRIPVNILILIRGYLNPPNRKNFCASFEGTPHVAEALRDCALEDDAMRYRCGLPSNRRFSEKETSEQIWDQAFAKMPAPMRTMYTGANLFFDVFNPFQAKETDNMHKAAIAVNTAVMWAENRANQLAVATFAEAEDFAKQDKQSLPGSAYQSIINALVDPLADCVIAGFRDIAREILAKAVHLAEKSRTTFPTRACRDAVRECVEGAMFSLEKPTWEYVASDMAMAQDLAKQIGETLPCKTYKRVISACTSRAIEKLKYKDWLSAESGFAVAKDLCEQAGEELPKEFFETITKWRAQMPSSSDKTV